MHSSATVFGHREVRRIIFGIMLAMLLGALDQTIVATALPTIGAEFGDFANLSWVVTAYLLATTVATPLYGKLSDVYGRRVLLLISIAVFTFASVACALAPNLLVLVLARGLQGLGGGGLISLSQTIIADLVPPRERGRYQSQIAGVFATASVAGPVLGGLFAQHVHWSLIFWINLPLGLAAYVVTDRALRRLPRHDRRHRVDLLGAGLMVTSAVALLLALTWGGVRYSWLSPTVTGLIGAAIVLAVLFVWRMRAADEPFLPLELLLNPVLRYAIPAASMMVATTVGLSIFVPVYFEMVRGLSAGQSGLGLIPLMGGVVCGAMVSARVMSRVLHYKRSALAGAAMAVLMQLVLALYVRSLPLPAVGVILALIGTGIGMVMPVCTVCIQNAVEPHRMGTATGVMTFFRQLGGALSVAVLGATLLGVVGTGAGADLESIARGASGGDLVHGFRYVFVAAAAMSLGGMVFLWAMEEKPLRTSVRAAAEEGAIGAE